MRARLAPRAVAVGAALALSAPAAPAAASAQAPQAVVGGGSFADAPLLEPGSYRDTILPGERLYYGVKLEAGQQLRVRAKLDVQAGEVGRDVADGFSIGLQTPLREVITDYDDDRTGNGTVGEVEDEFDVTYPAAVAISGARGEIDYTGPGIWYPSLYLIADERRPAKVELPVELELEVTGDPQPDASPEPTPAEAAPAPAPEPGAGEDDGLSGAAIAGIGLAGLVVGLVGGGLAARRS